MTPVLTARRIVFWVAVALAFAAMPLIFTQSFALSMQIGRAHV